MKTKSADLNFIKNGFLPLMILGKNGRYRKTINKILEEKGDFFIKLLDCDTYSSEQFVIEHTKIKDIYLNDFYVIKIKMPKDSLYHRSMAVIAYNKDMTLRKYITVEKGYKNSYDIYQWNDKFDYNAYDSYSENNLLNLIRGDYDYSCAPKAKLKKDLFEFFVTDPESTGAILLHSFIIICLLNFDNHVISTFLGENVLILIILLSTLYYFIFKKIKFLTERYIGEQSIIETSGGNLKIKKDLAKTAFKLGGILIAIGILTAITDISYSFVLALFMLLTGIWIFLKGIFIFFK